MNDIEIMQNINETKLTITELKASYSAFTTVINTYHLQMKEQLKEIQTEMQNLKNQTITNHKDYVLKTEMKNFVTCEECGAERNKCTLGRQLCTFDLLKSQEVFLKKTDAWRWMAFFVAAIATAWVVIQTLYPVFNLIIQ